MHNLLRDMCLEEAQKVNFLHIETVYNNSQTINRHSHTVGAVEDREIFKLDTSDFLKDTNSNRRIAIHLKSNERYIPRDLFDVQSTSFLRSLICDFKLDFEVLVDLRLLRVFDVHKYKCSEVIFQLFNSRYLNFELESSVLPSSICMFWNLQTIIMQSMPTNVAPVDIWKMPQLKHVMVYPLRLTDPPPVSQVDGQGDVIVLENLQTLCFVWDFRFTEEVVRKIPNVVKLKLGYGYECDEALPHYSLNNVRHLQKLQSLFCDFSRTKHNYLRDIMGFPGSLKKLILQQVRFSWEDITTKIGQLPHLEKLQLASFSAEEDEWNPVEGHFLHLKYLAMHFNRDLLCWTADSVHFPALEHLVVDFVGNLKEIPSGIGDIATLRLIDLWDCKYSVISSAIEILKEQKSLGNESIRLLVDRSPVIIEDSGDVHSE